LQVEGVAAGALDEIRDGFGRDGISERAPYELLRCSPSELSQVDGLDAPVAPEPRKESVDLGPREREDHQRLIRSLPPRTLDKPAGRTVSPVQVLEHEQHGAGCALGSDEVLPRA